MPKTCCVIGCSNHNMMPIKLSFHKFPIDENRRALWLTALKRKNKDGTVWMPTKNSVICGAHFISGTKSNDIVHPDYVPSINMGYSSESDGRIDEMNSKKRNKGIHKCRKKMEKVTSSESTPLMLMVPVKSEILEQPESEILPSCSNSNLQMFICSRPTVESSGSHVNNLRIESQNVGSVAHENNSGLIYNIKQEPVDDYSLTNVYNESQDGNRNSDINNDSQTNSFSPIIYDNVNSSDHRRKMKEVASSSMLSKTHVNQEKQSSTPMMVFRNAKNIQNTAISDSMGDNSSHNMEDNSSHNMGDNSSHNMGERHNTGSNSTTNLYSDLVKVPRLQTKDNGTDRLHGNQSLQPQFDNSKWRHKCLNFLREALQNTINRLEDLGVDVAAWVRTPNNDLSSLVYHMGSQKGREFINSKPDIDTELHLFLQNSKKKDNGQKNNSKDISKKKLEEDSCSVENIETPSCDGEPPKSISDNKAVPCSSLDDCKPTNVLFSVKGLDDNSGCIVVRRADDSSKEELQVNTASTSSSNEKEKIQLKRKISSVDTDPLSDEMNSNKHNKGIHKCKGKMEKVTSSDSTPLMMMVPVNIVILEQPVSEVLPSCSTRPTVETSGSDVNNICIENQNLGTVGHENNSGLIYNIKQEPVDDYSLTNLYNIKQEPVDDYSLTNVYNESQDGNQNSVVNNDSQTNSFSPIIDNVNSNDNT